MARADCKFVFVCKRCKKKAAMTDQGVRYHLINNHGINRPEMDKDYFKAPVEEYKHLLSKVGLNILERRGGNKVGSAGRKKRKYVFKNRKQGEQGEPQVIGINTKSILIPVMLEVPIVIGQAQIISAGK